MTQVSALCRAWLASAAHTGYSGAAVQRLEGVAPGGTLFASDALAEHLIDVQRTMGEGPAWSANLDRGPVMLTDLSDARIPSRWLPFAREASAAGAGAYCALPLRIGSIGLGVLAVHATTRARLGGTELGSLLAAAETISFALVDDAASFSAPDAVGPVSLNRAETLFHQAVGIAAVQLDASMETAIVMLRARAFASGLPLSEISRSVVERRFRFDADGVPPSAPGPEGGVDHER